MFNAHIISRAVFWGFAAFVFFALTPSFVSAAEFEKITITQKPAVVTIRLTAAVANQPAPKVVAKGTSVTIKWSSENATKCYSDFKGGELTASGEASGELNAARAFTMLCFGNGSSKAARIQLAVGAPSIAVAAGRGLGGLLPKRDANDRPISGVYIGGGKIIFQGKITNTGKLASPSTPVYFAAAVSQNNGRTWSAFSAMEASKRMVAELAPSRSVSVTYEHGTAAEEPGKAQAYRFAFCADVGAVGDMRDDKCAAVPGKYAFERR